MAAIDACEQCQDVEDTSERRPTARVSHFVSTLETACDLLLSGGLV